MFVVPVPYRKSLSWNTLRARKRAEAKDVSAVGLRGQENGLLRKPKETTPPPPLDSPATRAKGKVSKAGRRRTLVMSYVCAETPHLPLCPTWFLFFPLNPCVRRMCVCVLTYKHTHSSCCVWLQWWFSTCIRHEARLYWQRWVQFVLYLWIMWWVEALRLANQTMTRV